MKRLKARASVLLTLALTPAFAMAKPTPVASHPHTQTARDRAPKIHSRELRPHRR